MFDCVVRISGPVSPSPHHTHPLLFFLSLCTRWRLVVSTSYDASLRQCLHRLLLYSDLPMRAICRGAFPMRAIWHIDFIKSSRRWTSTNVSRRCAGAVWRLTLYRLLFSRPRRPRTRRGFFPVALYSVASRCFLLLVTRLCDSVFTLKATWSIVLSLFLFQFAMPDVCGSFSSYN